MTRGTRAFTIIELLVAMGILVVTIVSLTEVFNISSETTNRTAAHAEVLAASAALQQRLTDTLSKIEPGLLIIDSPDPAGCQVLRADVPAGPQYYRLRHDRLVFVASGGPDEFQSFTDPRRGQPVDDPATPVDETKLAPAASSSALLYFGPGTPLTKTRSSLTGNNLPIRFGPDAIGEATGLPGCEWYLANRAILFLLDPPNPPVPNWAPADMSLFNGPGGMLNDGEFGESPSGPYPPVLQPYCENSMDVVVSSATDRADASTFIDMVQKLPIGNLLTATSTARALWEANYSPTIVSTDNPAMLDYYTRTGSNFQPRLADFHIEWTDGRPVASQGTSDTAGGTRWFGVQVDPASVSPPGSLRFIATMRGSIFWDMTAAEVEAYRLSGNASLIEWATNVAGSPATDMAYRAVWRRDTWQFRPKALRFTYRIYDAAGALKNQEQLHTDEYGDVTPPTANPVITNRFGQWFSIVVPLP